MRDIEIYKGRPIFAGNFFTDDLRTPVGADMFAAYGKDPRVDTDAEVTVDEMAAAQYRLCAEPQFSLEVLRLLQRRDRYAFGLSPVRIKDGGKP